MDRDETGAMMFGALCGMLFGVVSGVFAASHIWRSEAITHKAGQYEATTGNFIWNDEVTK